MGIPKPDGTNRLVHNLIELNKRTCTHARHLINPSRTMRILPQTKYKTSLDLSNGFWSIPIDPQSQLKTCFTWGVDAYYWKRLPQRYKNSPNVFQTAVMKTLEDLPVEIYIDDVYFTHDDSDEHLKCLEEVLTRLAKIGLKKCEIDRRELTYLGFKISFHGKEITDSYKQKISEFPDPKSVTDLERFLGTCEYVSNHIPRMSEKAAPLHKLKGKLRKKNAPKDISQTIEALGHFRAMKTHVIQSTQHLERQIMETPLAAHLEIGEEGV